MEYMTIIEAAEKWDLSVMRFTSFHTLFDWEIMQRKITNVNFDP
jgi:hypothetical protein